MEEIFAVKVKVKSSLDQFENPRNIADKVLLITNHIILLILRIAKFGLT